MPPLVIARNQASCQNLVDSTKIERIKIDSKTAHRKEKKEKKKKERREHKKEKHEKSKSHKKQSLSSKKVSDESELEKSGLTEELEKSGLTEELEGPQNQLGYESDGSQNSKKRKRDDSPPAVESLAKATPVAAKPLRIRLIFKKPKPECPSLPREDPIVCSTLVAESLNHNDKAGQDVVTSSVPCSKASEPEENLPSTSAAAIAETKRGKKHRPSKEERYNALFDDWTPSSSICFPAMEVDSSTNDDDWLFGNMAQEKVNPKAVKIDEDMSISLHRQGDSSWPRAQFLPEVGIYSLPYTVPF